MAAEADGPHVRRVSYERASGNSHTDPRFILYVCQGISVVLPQAFATTFYAETTLHRISRFLTVEKLMSSREDDRKGVAGQRPRRA